MDMSMSGKKIDVSKIMKTLLALPSYEETPRKPDRSRSESYLDEQSFKGLTFRDSKYFSNDLFKTAEQFESCLDEKSLRGLTFRDSRSFNNDRLKTTDQLNDSDFFDSETGKKMILADTASRQEFSLQTKDPNFTACSSWVPCSGKKINGQADIRLSQYIKEYSDSVNGSLFQISSFDPVYSDCSTPVKKRKSVLSTDLETQMKDFFDTLNSTVTENTEGFQSFDCCFSSKNYLFSLNKKGREKKPMYRTPKKDESILECYKEMLGYTNYRNIQRLSAKDSSKATSVSGQSLMNSLSVTGQSSRNSLTVTGQSSMASFTDWLIEPTDVILDSSKGARVLLINNCSRNLKFSSKFDSKIANVCPLCGVIPARGKIGLRIVISSFLKKSFEYAEDEIKIIVGKEEKAINLKVIKGQKDSTLKFRSFITF